MAHSDQSEGRAKTTHIAHQESEVTTPQLIFRTYSLLGEQGLHVKEDSSKCLHLAWESNPRPLGSKPSMLMTTPPNRVSVRVCVSSGSNHQYE